MVLFYCPRFEPALSPETSPHDLALTPDEAARALVALARRVARLQPLNHDPEKYFVDRGEVEADMIKLADDMSPRASRLPERDTRFTPGAIEHRGRRVAVETRAPRARRDRSDDELKRVFK